MCFSPFLSSSSSSFPEVKRQRSVPEDPKRAMEEQLPATEAELRPPEEEVLHAYFIFKKYITDFVDNALSCMDRGPL